MGIKKKVLITLNKAQVPTCHVISMDLDYALYAPSPTIVDYEGFRHA